MHPLPLPLEAPRQHPKQPCASLLTVPPEILDNIASFAAVASTQTSSLLLHNITPRASSSPSSPTEPPKGMLYNTRIRPSHVTTPPNDLRSLLLVCRRFHHLLNLRANPHLYARVFRSKFDTAAIERRFGQEAVSSVNLAQELRRRCLVLRRMRRSVERQELCPGGMTEETYAEVVDNLWTAYMMLLENDGLNLQQLKWGQIESYLAIHHAQVMLTDAVRPGYPLDSVDRALALHLTYLLTDPEQLASECKDESEEKLFVLRPYVFAAHKYNAMLAPWTIKNLPLNRFQDAQGGAMNGANVGVGNAQTNPFLADLTPRSRRYEIEHCGKRLQIATPVLSQGALFSFFMKVERDPAVLGMGALLNQSDDDAFTGMGVGVGGDEGGGVDRQVRARSSRSPLSLSSLDHDIDVLRLLSCLDPYSSRGLSLLWCSGMFEGTWEGRFSFFDFDSYREMLAGRMRSLYEGPFGEQPQIWKIQERIVQLEEGEVPGGKGSVLGAGYAPHPEGAMLDDRMEEATAKEVKVVKREELWSGKGKARASEDAAKEAGRLGLPWDWAKYPRFQDEEDGGNLAERYEILLSGTGHSAWGRFVLRGRVRTWDGMLIMTKEYRPDGRGRWLYRGYSVAGGKLVGRWRDTFTPENMSGYEGCFLLHRREVA